jgi:hypothetical protein
MKFLNNEDILKSSQSLKIIDESSFQLTSIIRSNLHNDISTIIIASKDNSIFVTELQFIIQKQIIYKDFERHLNNAPRL